MKMQPYKIILLFLFTTALAACGGSSDPCSSFDEPGENWVWNGTVCQLRRDGFNWGVSSIAPALDGSEDLYAVGSFTYFKNKAIKHIARVNKDGSLDRGFVTGTGFNLSPSVVVSANDGSGDIYVGGMFSCHLS